MKYEIVWSAFAEKQIGEIYKFYYDKTKSLIIANRIIARVLTAPDSLGHSPEIGQIEPVLTNRKFKYRYIVESNYKLIYRINKEERQVRIVDVFDTRQSPVKIKRNK